MQFCMAFFIGNVIPVKEACGMAAFPINDLPE